MPSYTLVLLRHGQSQWNLENRFSGWTDVDLTDAGRAEARRAGHSLAAAGLHFDLAFTSVQRRATKSLEIVQEVMAATDLLIHREWRLNERHYGCLQGLNKADSALRLGQDRVMDWRRSYSARPPALEMDDHRHPRFDRRYAALRLEDLPRTESLADTVARLLPLWQTEIAPAVLAGRQILIVAHGNSLRALVQYLEAVPEAGVPAIQVPTGVPIVYTLGVDLRPISKYNFLE